MQSYFMDYLYKLHVINELYIQTKVFTCFFTAVSLDNPFLSA